MGSWVSKGRRVLKDSFPAYDESFGLWSLSFTAMSFLIFFLFMEVISTPNVRFKLMTPRLRVARSPDSARRPSLLIFYLHHRPKSSTYNVKSTEY